MFKTCGSDDLPGYQNGSYFPCSPQNIIWKNHVKFFKNLPEYKLNLANGFGYMLEIIFEIRLA